ncbi:hypothetical protein Ppb6_01228 [Photorhabdus australis subsp. thailandensis]|uniref:Uncharacterized protein n=1 Tax=Photorhabdus australis subsp. thailandensis TaxID=2805096 RepID=A0A1C0U6N6_9GAMM|nr:hypothetical protein [Photorhabdus australis]OCQ53602.1 hypothetical protein Ppb6_01228 [Photorhabdus australis subsp. thailandensis]
MASITLTTQQILYACDFAGIEYIMPDNYMLETEYTINDNIEIKDDDGVEYKGFGIYLTEYPEEGAEPLDK